jgi:hypothetical protein
MILPETARFRLLLKEEELPPTPSSSTSLKSPEELPSIEETLKTLSAALELLKTPRLEERCVPVTMHNYRR